METANKEQLTPCHRLPVLRRDDRQKKASDYVKLLQERLKKYHGFESLKADGFFGKKTEDAVKDYQGRSEDPNMLVDGIVGEMTWQALGMCVIISDR